MFNRSIPLILTLAAATTLLSTGCGIISAPVSVPQAVAENANFNLKGPVTDIHGTPLSGVMLAQQLDHHFWTPIAGGTDTDEHHLRRVDNTYTVSERGRDLKLTFFHEGFLDTNYTLAAYLPNTIQSDFGEWPMAKDFPVVLVPAHSTLASVIYAQETISYANYPQQEIMQFGPPDTYLIQRHNIRVDQESASYPPGSFYLTLAKEAPRPLNAKGDIDPADVNLPAKITLHIAGTDSGFIRITPKLGYPPILTSDLAPDTGYASEFTIDRNRLKEMRLANPIRIIEAREYFFFKAGRTYGKGLIKWTQQITKDSPRLEPAEFEYAFWIQRTPNNRDLTTRDAKNP